jgi:hypothetical protein
VSRDARDAAWEEGFNLLKTYKEREGHCRVPSTHKENGFPLGTWVANQRRLKSTTPIERRQRLEKLGFVWDTREKRDPAKVKEHEA